MISQLSRPLNKNEIEFRVGMTKKDKGITLLCYKTARTDTERLNEVCGMHWKPRFFYDEKKLLCCGISIYDKEIKEWIERVDVGTESNTEKEKGSYSDAFKRAGFKWGIGSELYNSPFIWINWNDWYNGKPNFRPNNLEVVEYEVKDNVIVKLELTYKGKHIYSHGKNYIPELTKEEKEEIEKKEKIENYQTEIKRIWIKRKALGTHNNEIVSSVKKDENLGVENLTDCKDLHRLEAYYLKQQNKLTEQENKAKEN